MSDPTALSCATCRFAAPGLFFEDEEGEHDDEEIEEALVVECRRFPPSITAMLDENEEVVVWQQRPNVGVDDWCGEHQLT